MQFLHVYQGFHHLFYLCPSNAINVINNKYLILSFLFCFVTKRVAVLALFLTYRF